MIPKSTNNLSEKIVESDQDFFLQKIVFRENSFDFVKIDRKDLNSVKFYYKDNEGNKIESINRLKSYLEKNDKKLIFAMNGGIFTEDFQPLGFYIENGKEISSLNLNKGDGNFYLKPNGVFQIKNNEANIVKSEEYQKSDDINFAVQSGPILVLNNEINPAFSEKSENKYIRNGVGINENGEVFFAISNNPVSLHDFSLFFQEQLKCENALYLDGAISEMYFLNERENVGKNFGTIIGVTN